MAFSFSYTLQYCGCIGQYSCQCFKSSQLLEASHDLGNTTQSSVAATRSSADCGTMAISLAQTPPRHQLHTNKHKDTQSLMCTRLRVIRNSALMTLDSVTPVLSLKAQNAFQTVFLAILGSQGFKNSAREGFQTRTILVHEYPHGNGRKVDMGERGKGFLTA